MKLNKPKEYSIFLWLCIAIGIIIFCSGCESIKDKKYTTNKLELRQLVKETEIRKETYGSYFLIGASYSSNEEKYTSIKVFAKVENRFRLIEIPIQDIRINIDNTLKTPNIQAEYVRNIKLTDEELINNVWQDKIYIINCPEQYLPQKLLPINL